MAHVNDNRHGRARRVFKPGHKIGIIIDGILVRGTVGSVDSGDWIYPVFPGSSEKPHWCRSTQVIDLED